MSIRVKLESYLHQRAPQRHILSVRLGKELCVRVGVDMVAGVCVRVVGVQHRRLRWVQGARHRGECVRAWIACHLKPK